MMPRHSSGETDEAEQALARYRLLSQHARDIMLFVRPDGRIVEANAAALTAYGYTREELLKLSVFDLRLAEERDQVARQLAQATAGSVSFETVHRRKDGSRFPVEVNSQSGVLGGERLLFSVVRDVGDRQRTERALRDSEERFRLATEALSGVVYDWDMVTGAIQRSQGLREITGYPEQDIPPVIGWWAERVHPEDALRVEQELQAAVAVRAPVCGSEYRLRHREGHYVWVWDRGRLLYDDDGRAVRMIGAMVSVDPRRRAEDALRRNEEQFRTVADAAPAMFWLADTENRTTWFNRRWLEFTGRSLAEEVGPGWTAGIHPDDRDRYERADTEAFIRRVPVSQEFRLRRHDGEYRWLLEECVPLYAPSGEFTGYVGACIDISERKGAEERLRLALAGARAGAWEWDLVNGKTSWSPELFELVGVDPLRSPASSDLFIELIHPDDREPTLEAFREAVARGGRFEFEFRVVRPDGATVWLSSAGDVDRDESGRPTKARGINLDVSVRKAAEEQLRLALAASQAGVWSWEVATGVTTWSPENYLLYGYDPGYHHPRYGDWESRIHPDDHARAVQAVREALEGRVPEYRAEYRIVHPERGIRWITSLGRVERAADGTPLRMSGINLDVTQRRETEARLQQAQRVQSVGRLAGGIAHEVNNLMTAVLGFGSFAIAELDPKHPARAEVEQMIRAGERAAAITRQLLAFTRQQVLRPERLDIGSVVRELVPVLGRLLGAEHQLVLRLDPGLGQVQADRGQLEQVLVNLALNSRDAMGGPGTVTVATQAADLDATAVARHPGIELRRGRYLQLSVSDTGGGMDEATRSRVFEPFFTTKPVGQGTGLGLSTVYGIVKQSEGYVWLYSEPGLGTTVKLYLPMADAPAVAVEPTAPYPGVPSANGEVVLVAEDEPVVRSLARRTLELHGYRVIEAADGRAALELLESLGGGVDLVLSDAVMPELSGRALGEIIGARWPAIPVIYMSGYPGKEVMDRGLVIPDAPFVAKPFTPEALARRTREVLDAARSWPGRGPGPSR